jgi:hypothetical protein
MPTIRLPQAGPYRFFFYSNEGTEPPHIHVESGEGKAKFWLEDPVRYANSYGFASHKLMRIQSLVQQHRTELLRAWNDHFAGE